MEAIFFNIYFHKKNIRGTKMKTEFTYRMHRRRNALALAGVIILVPLQLKLTVMIQEKYYMAVILITIL